MEGRGALSLRCRSGMLPVGDQVELDGSNTGEELAEGLKGGERVCVASRALWMEGWEVWGEVRHRGFRFSARGTIWGKPSPCWPWSW